MVQESLWSQKLILFVQWSLFFPISCLLVNVTACIPKTPLLEGEDSNSTLYHITLSQDKFQRERG